MAAPTCKRNLVFHIQIQSSIYPAGNYMLKLIIEALEQGVKYVQS